jgi:hypothetical protein
MNDASHSIALKFGEVHARPIRLMMMLRHMIHMPLLCEPKPWSCVRRGNTTPSSSTCSS